MDKDDQLYIAYQLLMLGEIEFRDDLNGKKYLAYSNPVTNIEACHIASSKPPQEWPRSIIGSTNGGLSIFGKMEEIQAGENILDVTVKLGVLESKTEARKAIKAGSLRLNGEVCQDAGKNLSESDLLMNLGLFGAAVLQNGKRGDKRVFFILGGDEHISSN